MQSARKRKATAAPTDEAGDDPLSALLKWCTLHGAVLDGCKLVQDTGGLARGFVATRNLKPGHCAIVIPHSLFVTTDVAMKSEVGALITASPALRVAANLEAERQAWANHADGDDDAKVQVISRRSVLYAYLIHQKHVEVKGAAWEPFVSSLPCDMSTPFSWSAAEVGHVMIRAEIEAL